MENSIEIKPIFKNLEKLEIDAFFREILANAEENKKIAEEQWKELPGEGHEWDLGLSSQLWSRWLKYNKEELKNKLPLLWNTAIENYKKFIKEDRWDNAEEWEILEDNQFMHLIEMNVETEFRKRLKELGGD